MKLELSIAADGGLVVRPPHPMSGDFPPPSRLVRPSTPLRETGSWAPTSAQATPSSSRCFAWLRTELGMSSSVVLASQVASRPVGPFGSVAARPGWTAASLSIRVQVEVTIGFLSGVDNTAKKRKRGGESTLLRSGTRFFNRSREPGVAVGATAVELRAPGLRQRNQLLPPVLRVGGPAQ